MEGNVLVENLREKKESFKEKADSLKTAAAERMKFCDAWRSLEAQQDCEDTEP